jgi:hypothetical protein
VSASLAVYLPCHNLLLGSPVFDSNGLLVFGRVINGCWDYRSNGVKWFAFRSDETDLLDPVTKWDATGTQELVFVPPNKRGRWHDYNDAIEWAMRQPPFDGDIQELLDRAAIDAVNMKAPHVEYPDSWDDDIAF